MDMSLLETLQTVFRTVPVRMGLLINTTRGRRIWNEGGDQVTRRGGASQFCATFSSMAGAFYNNDDGCLSCFTVF
jgi:hypothetical protein